MIVRESVPCNLCGADDPEVLLAALPSANDPLDYAASGDAPLRDRLVRCRRCELVYVSPRPQRHVIEEGYETVDNSVYLAQAGGRAKTFQRAIRWLESVGVSKGRLLDVGAAGGFFVKAAQDAGWDAAGLEISRHLCDYGRNQLKVPMTQGTLEQATFPERSFDLISYWDVLEHVADPADHLRRVRRLLKPNGTLLINYPNYASLWARLLGRRWWFLIDVHIYYFTPATLSKLLQKCGFQPGAERRHLQTLPLGYVFERAQGSFPRLGGGLRRLCRVLGLENFPMTYYASQKTMIARPLNG